MPQSRRLFEQELPLSLRLPWHRPSRTLLTWNNKLPCLFQANAQVAAAQQALLDEQHKREVAAENERLKKGLSDQHDAINQLIQNQQAETDKFRSFVSEYQNTIQNKQELHRDNAEAVKNAMSEERAAQAALQAANAAAAAGSQQTTPSAYPSYTDFT